MTQTATAKRFAFREAQRHMGRYLDRNDIGLASRFFKRIDAFLHACWMDFYGVEQASTLIIGPDRLLNLVIAFRCAAKGQRVIVYEGDQQEWNGYSTILSKRLCAWHPSFTGLIESTLGVSICATDTERELSQLCSDFVDDQGRCLVVSPDRIALFSDKLTESQKRFRFWVEPGDARPVPGIDPVVFWPQSTASIYDTEKGKADRFAIEVDQVVMTGIPGPSVGDTTADSIRVGEAMRPIGTFSVFRTKDRLQDVAESLGVDI